MQYMWLFPNPLAKGLNLKKSLKKGRLWWERKKGHLKDQQLAKKKRNRGKKKESFVTMMGGS